MVSTDPTAELPLVRDPVEELAEAFLERYRRGERPSLSEFTSLAPDHAEEILDLFPALVLMEQAQTSHPHGARDSLGVGGLSRVGDYRIVREVGRGGMGIVFEAVQETLGRRVALKILPAQALSSGAGALLRFRREARSAARLHHTNIVPVFDVGERDGIHYYAMQFIQGQGLDEVIAELRRFRESSDQRKLVAGAAPSASPSADLDGGAQSGACSDPLSSSTLGDGKFYSSAARIGLQAAEAMAYAHGQRVLHRDIKPANLLLDARGTVWVTDFGLAKEAGEDLTRTGSIVGTLRYLAPERLSGVSDAASDVYGLGMTLYELLTLQPAFAEADRAQLVRAIAHKEPVAPRRIDPHIPRDLETIVLKAIAKEPSARYATAELLADDLRRFLTDRPLLARRIAPWERMARWCRRNPGWAATTAVVLSLLLVIAIGGSLLNWHLTQALGDLQVASDDAKEQLWQSHLERARALRSSGRAGQRFRSLEAIREAAAIKNTRELSDEAAAALVLPDVEIAQEWEVSRHTAYLAVDDALKNYARLDTQGDLTLCRITPQGEQVLARARTDAPTAVHDLWLSRDGMTIVLARPARTDLGEGAVRIWRYENEQLALRKQLDEKLGVVSIAIHPDNRHVAIGGLPHVVNIVDVQSDAPPRTIDLSVVPRNMAYSPTGDALAVASGPIIQIIDVETGQVRKEFRHEQGNAWRYGMAWRPDGKVLAATSEDMLVHLWDVEQGVPMAAPLEGHTSPGIIMTFNHRGDRLISTSWDGQTRLWDAVSGDLLFTMPGRCGNQFGLDDTSIGVQWEGRKLRIWRVADGRELRRLRRPLAKRREGMFSPVADAEGQVLAVASTEGLVFFDLEAGRTLGFAPFNNPKLATPRRFDPRGSWLMGGHAAFELPAVRDPIHPEVLRVGPPRRWASAVDIGIDASADGRIRAIPRGGHVLVLDRDQNEARTILAPHYDVRYCAVSPDGARVGSFSWHSNGQFTSARIWDARSGKHVIDLPVTGSAWGRFSPNGRWLVTNSTSEGGTVWNVETWQPVYRFPGMSAIWDSQGDRIVIPAGPGELRFVDPRSGDEVLRLTGPESQPHTPAFLSADGSRLVSISDLNRLHVWELSLIGRQVRELGLEWNWSAPATPGGVPAVIPVQRVDIDLGTLLTPAEKSDAPWSLFQERARQWILRETEPKAPPP